MFKKIKNKIKSIVNSEVLYDETFFQDSWFENWDSLKFKLKDIIEVLDKRSIIDFGCGPGVMIDYMNLKGYHYIGCDYSEEAFNLYKNKFGQNIFNYKTQLLEIDLNNIELIISFDVFEHMTDEQIEIFFEQTKKINMYLLNISRQKGIPGHINLKNDNEWEALFKRNGLMVDTDKTNLVRKTYLDISINPRDEWEKNMFVVVRNP